MYLGDKVWACWVAMFLLTVVLICLWVLPLCQFVDELELLPQQDVNQTQKVDSLPKKMVKIVFVVGLEGTGHHFYDEFHKQIAVANRAKGGGDNATMFIDASFASRYLEGRGNHGLQTTNWNIYNTDGLFHSFYVCWSTVLRPGDPKVVKKMTKLLEPKYRKYNKSIADTCELAELCFEEYFRTRVVDRFRRNPNLKTIVLFFAHYFSFPYTRPVISNLPDLRHLQAALMSVQTTVDEKLKIDLDLKFVVTIRDYDQILRSACIRFGECRERALIMPFVLTEMTSQLMAFDARSWIVLDYQHVIQNPLLYVPTFCHFYAIDDCNIVTNALLAALRNRLVSEKGRKSQDVTTTQTWSLHYQLDRKDDILSKLAVKIAV